MSTTQNSVIILDIYDLAKKHLVKQGVKKIELIYNVGLGIDKYLNELYKKEIISYYSCILYEKKRSHSSSREEVGDDFLYWIEFDNDESRQFCLDVCKLWET